MSLGAALNVAVSGLATLQAQTRIVSGNVANAQNPNYSRKVASLTTPSAEGLPQAALIASITQVANTEIRQDLYEATSVHRLLQALLGLPAPLYHHHRLVLGPDGRKLSKSEKSTGLRALREAGATPQEVRTMLGFTQVS